jgi:hypothetical protein
MLWKNKNRAFQPTLVAIRKNTVSQGWEIFGGLPSFLMIF